MQSSSPPEVPGVCEDMEAPCVLWHQPPFGAALTVTWRAARA